jgi:hypothetical protein
MSKKTDSGEETKNPFFNPTVLAALITGIVGLIVALITTLPILIPLLSGSTETPIPTLTATVLSTSPAIETPTKVLSTDTATQISPAPTETVTLTPTPITPPISCLNRWQVISSDPDLAETTSQGDCEQANVPGLGISSSQNGLSIGVNNFQKQGTFGIATSLPTAVTVTMQVDLNLLTQGEFWIAISNSPNPEDRMMILAMEPKTGEVRIYNDQTSSYSRKYEWSQLLANTSLTASSPHTYKITFAISGNSISPQIYFTNLPSQIVNLPKYLFIGYNNKSTLGSMTLQAEISDLNFEK